MKSGRKPLLFIWALLLGICPALMAGQFDFTYSSPAPGIPGGVTASGVLTTTAFDPVAMDYTIIGVTGTRTIGGVNDTIASLLAPGAFGGNDNLLFPGSPFLNSNGFSFSLATGAGDDGNGNVNVFYNPSQGAYTENSSAVGFGTFTITPITVPEPVPPTAAVLAVTAFVYAWRKRRLQ